MSVHYYLNEDKSYTSCDVMKWCDQFENMERHVADEVIDGFRVSTVWLGLDHNYGDGEPLLFETMIFGKSDSYDEIYMKRYSTWEEAEEGHRKAIEWVRTNYSDKSLEAKEEDNAKDDSDRIAGNQGLLDEKIS
jgi:hypothetical protein